MKCSLSEHLNHCTKQPGWFARAVKELATRSNQHASKSVKGRWSHINTAGDTEKPVSKTRLTPILSCWTDSSSQTLQGFPCSLPLRYQTSLKSSCSHSGSLPTALSKSETFPSVHLSRQRSGSERNRITGTQGYRDILIGVYFHRKILLLQLDNIQTLHLYIHCSEIREQTKKPSLKQLKKVSRNANLI